MDLSYLLGNFLVKYTPVRVYLWTSPKHFFKVGKYTWKYIEIDEKYLLTAYVDSAITAVVDLLKANEKQLMAERKQAMAASSVWSRRAENLKRELDEVYSKLATVNQECEQLRKALNESGDE